MYILVLVAGRKGQHYLPAQKWSTTCDFRSHWNLLCLRRLKSAPLAQLHLKTHGIVHKGKETQFCMLLTFEDAIFGHKNKWAFNFCYCHENTVTKFKWTVNVLLVIS